MSDVENAEENATSSEHADKTMTGVYCTFPLLVLIQQATKELDVGNVLVVLRKAAKYANIVKVWWTRQTKKGMHPTCMHKHLTTPRKIKQISQPVKSGKIKFLLSSYGANA